MGQAELLIAGILVGVAGLSALARLLAVPYPIVLVIGGALFGFVPGVEAVHLDPDVVLVVFLPPLLYGAAFFANLGDLRANLRSLTMVSVGLVLVTMVVVAWAAHMLVPDMSWAAAFVLGAVVSPTDPLAGALIMRRIGVPRRIVSGVEGEGLFNDATALVAYKVAVAAAVSGSFSLGEASLKFVLGAVGGLEVVQRAPAGHVHVAVVGVGRHRPVEAQRHETRLGPEVPAGFGPQRHEGVVAAGGDDEAVDEGDRVLGRGRRRGGRPLIGIGGDGHDARSFVAHLCNDDIGVY